MAPEADMSIIPSQGNGKITVPELLQRKSSAADSTKKKITCLTAYDYPTARLVDEAGVDVVLVGDSLAMVMLGYDNTLPLTIEESLHHTKAARRGVHHALLVADMPYGTYHGDIHESVKKFLDGFHYDAHPMGMMISAIAALSTFYPEARDIFNPASRRKQTYRLIGKMPTLAAFSYRHSLGMPFSYPDNELSYPGNFLSMLFKTSELKYRPNPTLERALDVLFILHADHEQNCSANAMRCVGSSHVDPFSAAAAATAALYGPLHGGANEEVLRMLVEIGSLANVPAFIKRVKAGETKLMGFGHRVYKNYDPRARIIKHVADGVFEIMGRNPLLNIALECERIALEDDYFVSRKLYPNVDFYTGLIYQSMGFPATMFPVLFAIPRTSGWIAQWEEMLLDPEQKIARPRQIYLGHDLRPYPAIDQRS